MSEFRNVSILLPTLNETFSFEQTVDIILTENDFFDLKEFIAIVCDRTEPESLQSIARATAKSEARGIPLVLLYQSRPFAGGAVQDGMDAAQGSHTIMMAPDLETDPHTVPALIASAKCYPDDITTASRWIQPGSFDGYSNQASIFFFYCIETYSSGRTIS